MPSLPTNQSNNQPQKLLNVSKIIKLAQNKGYDFGKGDPKLRLRYLNRLGLIPYAVRHQNKPGQKYTTGFYPDYLPQLLLKIQDWQKNNLSADKLVVKSKQFQNKHSNINSINTIKEHQSPLRFTYTFITTIASIIFFLFASTLLVWANEETNAFPWLNKYLPIPVRQAIRSISSIPNSPFPIDAISYGQSPSSYLMEINGNNANGINNTNINATTLQSHPASDFLLLSDYTSLSNALTLSSLSSTDFLRSNTNDYLEGDSTKLYLSPNADRTTYYLASDGEAHFKILNTDSWANTNTVGNLSADLLDGLSEDNFLRSNTSDYLTGNSTYLYLDEEADNQDYYLSSTGNAILNELTTNNLSTNNLTTTLLTATNLSSSLIPTTTNTYNLGSSTYQFKDLYIDGTAYLDTINTDSFQMAAGAISGYALTTDANGTATWTDVSSSAGPWTLASNNLYPDSTSYNVGIGNTSPLAKLDVNGTAWLRGTGTSGLFVDLNGNVGIGTTGAGAKLEVKGLGNDSSSSSLHITDSDGSTIFLIRDDGKVGIGGDVGPSDVLKLTGSMYATGNIYSSGAIYQNGGIGILSGGRITYQNSTNNPYITMTGSTITFLSTDAADTPLIIKADGFQSSNLTEWQDSSGTGLVAIDSNGNVGIATTSPASLLDVHGTSWLRGASADQGLYVNSSGNVGVGTTGPSEKLHINDGVVKIERDGTGLTALQTFNLNEANPRFYLNNKGDMHWGAGGGSSVDTILYRDSANKLRTSDSLIIDANVGIGTTGPGYKLDVTGGVGSQIRVRNSVNTGGYLSSPTQRTVALSEGVYFHGSNSQVTADAYWASMIQLASSDIKFFTFTGLTEGNSYAYAGYERMRIDSSGNVGIATTSPASLLDVHGTSWLRGASADQGLYVNSSGNVGVGTTGPEGKLHVVSTPGMLAYLQGSAVTGTEETYMRIRQDAGGRSGWTDLVTGVTGATDGYFAIKLRDAGEAVRIDKDGNVGIGTTSPSSLLHLASTTDVGLLLDADTNNSGENDNPSITLKQDGGVVVAKMGLEGNTPGTLYTDSLTHALYFVQEGNSPIQFGVGNTAKVTIDGHGNVGIGVATPGSSMPTGWVSSSNSRMLEVRSGSIGSDTGVTIRRSDGAKGLDLWTDGGNGDVYIDSRYDSTANQLLFRTRTAGTALTAMAIDGNGNVGIATTSPASLLDVHGTSWLRGASADQGLYVNSSGNVGIGTTDPGTKLHVVESGGGASIYIDGSNGNSVLSLQDSGTARWAVMNDGSTDNLWFREDGTDVRLTIEEGGNVGIATTSPASLLDVHGTSWLRGASADQGLYVNSSGNVGVGTTEPGVSLEVNGGIRAKGGEPGALGVNNVGYAFTGGSGDNDSGMFSTADGLIQFFTDSTEKVRINSSGYLGIGTTGPTQKLDVVGSIKSSALDSDGAVYSNAGVLTNVNPSSLAYKYNVNDWGLDPKRVLGLTVKSFKWKRNDRSDFGLIAEEVQAAVPELYMEDLANGIKGYRLDHLSFHLLEIAKEHELSLNGNGELISDLHDTNLGMVVANDLQDNNLISLEARLDAQESTASALLKEIKNMDNKVTSLEDKLSLLQEQIDLFVDEEASDSADFTATDSAKLDNLVIYQSLNVLGNTVLNKLGVTGNINAGLIVVDGIEGSINSLGNTLYLQNLFGSGDLDVFNGAIVMTSEGNVRIEGSVEAEKVKVKEVNTDKVCIGKICLSEEDLKRLIEASMSAKIN